MTRPETPAGEVAGHPAPCPATTRPDSGAVTDSQIAVLLTQLHWVLDAAAHDWPRGEVLPAEREQLAAALVNLAEIVRASVPDGGGTP